MKDIRIYDKLENVNIDDIKKTIEKNFEGCNISKIVLKSKKHFKTKGLNRYRFRYHHEGIEELSLTYKLKVNNVYNTVYHINDEVIKDIEVKTEDNIIDINNIDMSKEDEENINKRKKYTDKQELVEKAFNDKNLPIDLLNKKTEDCIIIKKYRDNISSVLKYRIPFQKISLSDLEIKKLNNYGIEYQNIKYDNDSEYCINDCLDYLEGILNNIKWIEYEEYNYIELNYFTDLHKIEVLESIETLKNDNKETDTLAGLLYMLKEILLSTFDIGLSPSDRHQGFIEYMKLYIYIKNIISLKSILEGILPDLHLYNGNELLYHAYDFSKYITCLSDYDNGNIKDLKFSKYNAYLNNTVENDEIELSPMFFKHKTFNKSGIVLRDDKGFQVVNEKGDKIDKKIWRKFTTLDWNHHEKWYKDKNNVNFVFDTESDGFFYSNGVEITKEQKQIYDQYNRCYAEIVKQIQDGVLTNITKLHKLYLEHLPFSKCGKVTKADKYNYDRLNINKTCKYKTSEYLIPQLIQVMKIIENKERNDFTMIPTIFCNKEKYIGVDKVIDTYTQEGELKQITCDINYVDNCVESFKNYLDDNLYNDILDTCIGENRDVKKDYRLIGFNVNHDVIQAQLFNKMSIRGYEQESINLKSPFSIQYNLNGLCRSKGLEGITKARLLIIDAMSYVTGSLANLAKVCGMEKKEADFETNSILKMDENFLDYSLHDIVVPSIFFIKYKWDVLKKASFTSNGKAGIAMKTFRSEYYGKINPDIHPEIETVPRLGIKYYMIDGECDRIEKEEKIYSSTKQKFDAYTYYKNDIELTKTEIVPDLYYTIDSIKRAKLELGEINTKRETEMFFKHKNRLLEKLEMLLYQGGRNQCFNEIGLNENIGFYDLHGSYAGQMLKKLPYAYKEHKTINLTGKSELGKRINRNTVKRLISDDTYIICRVHMIKCTSCMHGQKIDKSLIFGEYHNAYDWIMEPEFLYMMDHLDKNDFYVTDVLIYKASDKLFTNYIHENLFRKVKAGVEKDSFSKQRAKDALNSLSGKWGEKVRRSMQIGACEDSIHFLAFINQMSVDDINNLDRALVQDIELSQIETKLHVLDHGKKYGMKIAKDINIGKVNKFYNTLINLIDKTRDNITITYNDSIINIDYKMDSPNIDFGSMITIAAITCYSRMELQYFIDVVGNENVLYCDTDSMVVKLPIDCKDWNEFEKKYINKMDSAVTEEEVKQVSEEYDKYLEIGKNCEGKHKKDKINTCDKLGLSLACGVWGTECIGKHILTLGNKDYKVFEKIKTIDLLKQYENELPEFKLKELTKQEEVYVIIKEKLKGLNVKKAIRIDDHQFMFPNWSRLKSQMRHDGNITYQVINTVIKDISQSRIDYPKAEIISSESKICNYVVIDKDKIVDYTKTGYLHRKIIPRKFTNENKFIPLGIDFEDVQFEEEIIS